MTTPAAQTNDVTQQFAGSHYPIWESWLPKLSDSGPWAQELSRWYESDWQLAIETGRRPAAQQVLLSLDEAQRSVVQPVFDSIDAHYNSLLRHASRPTLDAGNDATVQLPATKIESPIIEVGPFDLPTQLSDWPVAVSGKADAQVLEATINRRSDIEGVANPATLEFSFGSATDSSRKLENAANPATMDFSVGSVSAPRRKVVARQKLESTNASASLPKIPGYRIDGVLGRGGMGVVYLAQQLGIDRPVAIKMVLSGIHSSRTLLDRFLAEAKAVGRLKHENIVQIYDSGWHADLPYFSLEFVDGPALSEKLGSQPTDPVEAAHLVIPLANALQYAHSQGIIHRDVKPANVLLTSTGIPKLADFGLAKQQQDNSDLSRTGDVIGTPGYMAPEQARGESDITGSVDIYGLGGVLYCALTGRPPFQAAKPVDTIIQLLEHDPVAPSRLQPGVPKDLETICLKCLRKDPTQRYATADDLAMDLKRFVNGEPIAARPVTKIERLYRWGRRKPRIAALAASAILSVLLLTIGGPILAGVIYAQKRQVEQSKIQSDQNALLAKRSAEEASANAQLAEENARQAQQNSKAAETQGKNAVDALKSLVFEVQRTMRDKPGLQQTRQALLGVAQDGLKRLDGSTTLTKTASIEAAGISRRLGDLNYELGRVEKAYGLYEECLNNLMELDKNGKLPKNGYRHNFSTAYELLMSACRNLGRLSDARKYGELCLEHRRNWVKEEPDNEDVRQNLATTLGQLGALAQEQGDMDSAQQLLTESAQMRREFVERRPGQTEPLTQWIGARRALARLAFQQGDRDSAIEQMKSVIAEQSKLAAEFGHDVSSRGNLAIFHNDLATFQLYVGKQKEAIDEYESASEIMRKLIEDDPKNFSLKEQLGNSLYGLSVAQSVADLAIEASKTLSECLEIYATAKELDPSNLAREIRWLLTAARAGNLSDTIPLASKAKSRVQTDAGMVFNLACVYAQMLAAAQRGSELPEGITADALAEESLALVQKSFDLGFRRTTDLEMDPDLAPIRGLGTE